VSSDPFADLAGSLETYYEAFRDLLGPQARPKPGSPALTEAENEPYAGEWSRHPARDVVGMTFQAAVSSTNHLTALALTLRARSGPEPAYTVARAAAEHAAAASYLTDPTIDARERIRRGINRRLDGLCEQLSLLTGLNGPLAQADTAHVQARIEAISRTGKQHGFAFRKKDGPGRQAYLGKRPPSPTTLIDNCLSQEPGLGTTYQRLLSSVAHAKTNGLTRLLTPGQPVPGTGERTAQINPTSDRLALELLVGPLCATHMIERLCWYTGWDTHQITEPVNQMLATWAHVAEIPSWIPLAPRPATGT
jgi:hypothetical protein